MSTSRQIVLRTFIRIARQPEKKMTATHSSKRVPFTYAAPATQDGRTPKTHVQVDMLCGIGMGPPCSD